MGSLSSVADLLKVGIIAWGAYYLINRFKLGEPKVVSTTTSWWESLVPPPEPVGVLGLPLDGTASESVTFAAAPEVIQVGETTIIAPEGSVDKFQLIGQVDPILTQESSTSVVNSTGDSATQTATAEVSFYTATTATAPSQPIPEVKVYEAPAPTAPTFEKWLLITGYNNASYVDGVNVKLHPEYLRELYDKYY